MLHPPHLPPKSCSVPLYRRFMLSSSLIIITIIAFVSGLVGGIVSDVYIVSDQGLGTNIGFISRGPAPVVTDVEDPVFLRDQLRRSVTLVKKDVYTDVGYIPLTNTYEAVLLTDTGWFVMSADRESIFQPEEWLAVTLTGETYTVDSFRKDPEYDLVYGTLQGEGFRVTSFASVSSLIPGVALWAMHESVLERTELAYPSPVAERVRTAVGDAQYTFAVQSSLASRSILWTDEGALFGFVNADGSLVPWFVIESIYTDVFLGKTISRDTLPIAGHMVRLTEKQRVDAEGVQYGFFVEMFSEGSGIKKGDLITHVGDIAIEPWTMQALVAQQKGESVSLRLLREGERVDISVLKDIQD
ncbi:MAG: hypothetical protein ACD_48C00502G0005 [uncultured bacterium]|nr:MAG: hypothetical protein ACD_48C00502G0005 [uncultured bacterium]